MSLSVDALSDATTQMSLVEGPVNEPPIPHVAPFYTSWSHDLPHMHS